MRATILDQRIAGVSYGWEGQRNNSPSVHRVNGAVVRRNIFPDPRGTNATGWSTALGDVSSITDFPGDIATAQRHTRTSGGVAAFRRLIPTLAASTTYAVRFKVRASAVTAGFGLHIRPSVGGPTAQTTMVSNQTLQIGVTEFTAVVTTSDTAVTDPGFAAVWSGGTTGDTIDMTAMLISSSTVMVDYFDGDTAVNAATINGITL